MKKKKEVIFSETEFTAVNNAYIKIYDNFKKACEKNSLKVRSPDATGFSYEHIGGKKVKFKFNLYFPDWPYKKDKNEKIDIFLNSSEVFSFEKNHVIESKVGLKYLQDGKDKTSEPILDVHYDYDEKVSTAHPVFHVQLGSIEIPVDIKKQFHFEKHIQRTEQLLYSNIRIPTPYMNITSVLLSLAADHLKPENYLEFLDNVRKSEAVKWKVACSPLDVSLRSADGTVHSHQWYFG